MMQQNFPYRLKFYLRLRLSYSSHYLIPEKLASGNLDSGRLDSGRLDSGRLDSGRLDSGQLDGWTLDAPTLGDWIWTLGPRKFYPF